GAAGRVQGGVGVHGSSSSSSLSSPPEGDAALVSVLRQELAKMGRDREVLLQQLAQVSSSAEERIRLAQAAMQERESRHREALVAARVQAAQREAEAAAEQRVQAAESAAAALATQVRQQLAAALTAAEEACRHTEALAGVRLSRALVRLQDVEQQVALLRAAQQRAAAELRVSRGERERLRQELAAARVAEAELSSQLAGRDSEARAQVAALRTGHEEALAAERRRCEEAERLAAKAAAECGQLERQLARLREVRAQQEDARLRRLQSQVHEQETQLRSLRRERSTLLAALRKQGWAPPAQGEEAARTDLAAADDTDAAAITAGDVGAGNATEATTDIGHVHERRETG
ncbi:hypothetical protein Agub_g677, partial [Astrephomene gubernaculifera]